MLLYERAYVIKSRRKKMPVTYAYSYINNIWGVKLSGAYGDISIEYDKAGFLLG